MDAPQSITRHVVLISGFRQRHGRATTGLDDLWHRLRSELVGPDCAVWLKCWDDDFRALAAQIKRYSHGKAVRVSVAAYSWGVGHGAVTFAKELKHYGIDIDVLYSIDGVYRHWLPLRSLFSRRNPLAPRIVVPSNVRSVRYWRQTTNYPQGHELVAELNDHQVIIAGNDNDGVIEGYTHQQIDNARHPHEVIFQREAA